MPVFLKRLNSLGPGPVLIGLARVLFFALMVGLAALSAPAPSRAQVSQETQITADRFVVRESEGNSRFSGNVVVTQPGLKVLADEVVVHFGAGGTSDVKSFEAVGNVRIETDTQVASGDRAVYDPGTRILKLTGNVLLINDSGTVNAGTLRIDLTRNVTEFSSGGDGGRVTGLFGSGS